MSALEHREALEDREFFCGAALILSVALAEAAAREALSLRGESAEGAIEVWGERLLATSPYGARGWTEGLSQADVVEVALVRNAFAHGTFEVAGSHLNRLAEAGEPDRFGVGATLSIDDDALTRYRSVLARLLRKGGLDSPAADSSSPLPKKPRTKKPTRRERLIARWERARPNHPTARDGEPPW